MRVRAGRRRLPLERQVRPLLRRGQGCTHPRLVRYRTVWCNPPFSATLIEKFVAKAIEAAEQGSTVVLLLPHWPGYAWYQEVKRRGQIRDVIGTVRFQHHRRRFRRPQQRAKLSQPPGGSPGTALRPRHERPADPQSGSTGATELSGQIEPAYAHNEGKQTRQPGVKPPGTQFTRLSELEPQATEWLWHLRIPKGELTIVDGVPSVNKSSLLMDIAARVTKGRKMPDGTEGKQGCVLLLQAEDSIKKTVLQRLQAANADLRRISVPNRTVILPRDLSLIEEIACQIQASLIVIDSIMAFLGVDANGDQKVRGALHRSSRLLRRPGSLWYWCVT